MQYLHESGAGGGGWPITVSFVWCMSKSLHGCVAPCIMLIAPQRGCSHVGALLIVFVWSCTVRNFCFTDNCRKHMSCSLLDITFRLFWLIVWHMIEMSRAARTHTHTHTHIFIFFFGLGVRLGDSKAPSGSFTATLRRPRTPTLAQVPRVLAGRQHRFSQALQ